MLMQQSASLFLPLTEAPIDAPSSPASSARFLSDLPLRSPATITGFHHSPAQPDAVLVPEELERRLVEIGFVEGAMVQIEHAAGLAGDPLAIRIDGRRLVALRRREARCVAVRATPDEARL